MTRKSITTPVSAKTIRTAFQNGTLDAAKVVNDKNEPVPTGCLFGGPQGRGRGRLNPAFVQAFLAANPGTSYSEKSDAEQNLVEVPRVSAKTGRPIKSVRLPIAEVRVLSGTVGKKGRLSSADLAKAGATYQG